MRYSIHDKVDNHINTIGSTDSLEDAEAVAKSLAQSPWLSNDIWVKDRTTDQIVFQTLDSPAQLG